jgi:IS5 family transposase
MPGYKVQTRGVPYQGCIHHNPWLCLIVWGNPADSDQYQQRLEHHKEQYGKLPRQVTADDGFASKDSRAFAKEKGIKNAVFVKKRGLSILEMANCQDYTKLRNFRTGIESGILTLKRVFGLDRCTWSGLRGLQTVCPIQYCLL